MPRNYGAENIVCVCNATYCDTVDPITPLQSRTYVAYTSSKTGVRFNKSYGAIKKLESKESSSSGISYFCFYYIYTHCIIYYSSCLKHVTTVDWKLASNLIYGIL